MNEDLRKWLEVHGAVSVLNLSLDNGTIRMYHVNGRTFLIRLYEMDGNSQGWEVFHNLDPGDDLTVEETLAALSSYCFPGRGRGTPVPTKPMRNQCNRGTG